MINITKYLNSIYEKCIDNIFLSEKSEHYLNLNQNQNSEFLRILNKNDCKTTIKLCMPNFEEMIFSAKREAALELLDQNKQGVCIDYGAMWGALSIGMAKRGHQVIAVDQKYDLLRFLKSRYLEEGLENIHLVQDDLKEVQFKNIADYALLNGVLEFMLKKSKNSREIQVSFLKRIYESINQEGQLLIGIENKLSYRNLIGKSNKYTYSFNEIKNYILQYI